jgi:hypothetical protein
MGESTVFIVGANLMLRRNGSLFGRLSGGGCSQLRTHLWAKIPVNREIYREFCSSERLNRVHPLVKTGVNGFRPEIGTGNEQGNNRRHNREKASRRKSINAPYYLAASRTALLISHVQAIRVGPGYGG